MKCFGGTFGRSSLFHLGDAVLLLPHGAEALVDEAEDRPLRGVRGCCRRCRRHCVVLGLVVFELGEGRAGGQEHVVKQERGGTKNQRGSLQLQKLSAVLRLSQQ
ncbi:hypothetical protein RJ640_005390 [Escallonia rubra]|uniref:Secreted protein n=1 Tax=Escallonia rubra TaxID=112253 RepID=A0AA88UGU3_9ASTE|nr:hypothetical protein RJ640_005390 [Escallonia rubra]